MRLRLSVNRYGLPTTNVLWNVPDNVSPQAYTIARLLEDVNAILPLEAKHWGFEDYVVEIDGFECLHFTPVSQALKDDDHVTVRPLLTAEVRARTLTGRYQINEGGQHLVDGVPFGRPLLRAPNRPPVRIPKRKRQESVEDAAEAEEQEPRGLITARGEMVLHTDGASDATGGAPVASQRVRPTNGRKYVHFTIVLDGEEDSEEEDDEDFAPGDEAGDSDESMNSSSEDSSSDFAGPSSDDDSGGSKKDSSEASSDDSSSESDSDDSDAGESEGESVKESRIDADVHVNPPGKGQKTTKARNQRRKDVKRLFNIKCLGLLPEDATLPDLRAFEANGGESITANLIRQLQMSKLLPATPTLQDLKDFAAKEKSKLAPTAAGSATPLDDGSKKRKRDDELLGSAQETGVDTNGSKGALEQPETPIASPQVPSASARKRLRPDVSAITRILGHQVRKLDKRAPKPKLAPVQEPAKETNDDPVEEALEEIVKDVIEEPIEELVKELAHEAREEAMEEEEVDPDFWKSRINLSAYECWEEGYELSAPPYPFKQHWDPASEKMRNKAKKKAKKNAPKTPSSVPFNEPENPFDNPVLDYGDGDADSGEGDINAAIESQLRQDVATAARSDLPPVPEDIEALPVLSQSDIAKGAIIVFKHFGLNPINMNPEITDFKTAKVEEEGDSGNGAGVIGLRLAERDTPRTEKKFDRGGNRIYEGVQQFQVDLSDDEEDGLMHVQFGELLEARLLVPAGGAAEGSA